MAIRMPTHIATKTTSLNPAQPRIKKISFLHIISIYTSLLTVLLFIYLVVFLISSNFIVMRSFLLVGVFRTWSFLETGIKLKLKIFFSVWNNSIMFPSVKKVSFFWGSGVLWLLARLMYEQIATSVVWIALRISNLDISPFCRYLRNFKGYGFNLLNLIVLIIMPSRGFS